MTLTQQFSGMYPNTNIAFNISPNTMYGKFILDKEENDDPKIDIGKEFLENLPIGNNGTLGSVYFGLPKFEDLYKEFRKEIKIKESKTLNIGKEDLLHYHLKEVKIKIKGEKKNG